MKIYSPLDALGSSEQNLALTEVAVSDPALRDLATSIRGAHLDIQTLSFHLLELIWIFEGQRQLQQESD